MSRFTARFRTVLLVVALSLLAPVGLLAQEVQKDEMPDDGFRFLAPRTVVSFVRQTVRQPVGDATDFPRWTTVVHVSNVGNGPMGAAAIFVASDGSHRSATRFPVSPGQTVSVTVAEILTQAQAAREAAGMPPEQLPDDVTGIVIVRFFTPTEAAQDRFFAQMVSAEQFLDLGPNVPPVIVPLDVKRPQAQMPRRVHDRR
ncbi:MAG: hypothetical protein ACE5IK_02990 [Acidobacteriota bacterium]